MLILELRWHACRNGKQERSLSNTKMKRSPLRSNVSNLTFHYSLPIDLTYGCICVYIHLLVDNALFYITTCLCHDLNHVQELNV